MTDKDIERLKEEKRARSEAKRLEALRVKGQESRSRDHIVGSALKDIDSIVKPKKITFDSDSDNDERKKRLSNDEGTKSKKPRLFDTDDEEEDDIEFKNRHKGEKGIKLMEIESRYGYDGRFKLDDKFDDSDDDKEKDKEDEDEETKERKKEKEGALNVLARVLGHEIKRKEDNGKKRDKEKKAKPFFRFDPENEEHVKWMKDNAWKKGEKDESVEDESDDDEDNDKKKKKKDEEKEIVTVPKIEVEGRYYEMGGSFAEELRAKLAGEIKDDEPFSFLASIGRKSEEKKEVIENINEDELKKNEKNKDQLEETVDDPIGFESTSSTAFFFDIFSQHARSVVANFRRTQSIDKIKETWSNHRDSIVKTYKNQRRFAMKSIKDEMRKGRDGYERMNRQGMFKKKEKKDEEENSIES